MLRQEFGVETENINLLVWVGTNRSHGGSEVSRSMTNCYGPRISDCGHSPCRAGLSSWNDGVLALIRVVYGEGREKKKRSVRLKDNRGSSPIKFSARCFCIRVSSLRQKEYY